MSYNDYEFLHKVRGERYFRNISTFLMFSLSSTDIVKKQNKPDFRKLRNQVFYFFSGYLRNELEKQNFLT